MSAITRAPRTGMAFEDGVLDFGLIGPLGFSLFAFLLALMLADAAAPTTLLNVLVGLECVMLATSAAMSTSGACAREAQWAARVAPSRGAALARERLWRQLRFTGAWGAVGPLVLAARYQFFATWYRQGVPAAVLAALILLAASQLLGAWCGMAWRGRAPRWNLWGWLVLGAMLAVLGDVRLLLQAWPVVSVIVLAGVAAGWRALAGRLCNPLSSWAGVPLFSAPTPPTARPTRWRWEQLRFSNQELPRPSNFAGRWPFAFMTVISTPQLLHSRLWAELDWNGVVTGWRALAYGGWLGLLVVFACTSLIHPGLHWRQRLAPGGATASAWAWRMLGGSGIMLALWLAAMILLVWAFGETDRREQVLGSLPMVLTDLSLALAFGAWVRGLSNTPHGMLLGCLALGGAVAAISASLDALGWPLVRGVAWMPVELMLTALFARAAVQVWAKRDLNELSAAP